MMRIATIIPTLLFFAILGAPLRGGVTVKREPPEIQTKTFDPANPPAEMPHLNHGESAVTAHLFRVQVGSNYEPVSRTKNDSGWTSVVAVHGITLTLKLSVTIWVPQGVSDKLRAHEEGHRKIAERIYQERALIEAKAAGALADGKQFTGDGPDWKTAAGNAVNPILSDVGKAYLKHTADMTDKVSNVYDDLTHHGTNEKAEEDAIKGAFEKYKATHADKK